MADGLTDAQREAVRAYIESSGRPIEAARRLGIPRTTLHSRLSLVKKKGLLPAIDGGEPDPLGLLTPEGAARQESPADPPPPGSAPKGWEPGVVWKGSEGTLSCALDSHPDLTEWDQLLSVWDLDPARYCVIGEPEFRAWDTSAKNAENELVTKRLYYYKARIGLRSSFVPSEEVDFLVGSLNELTLPEEQTSSDLELVVCLADWQFGKGDGDGLEGTVKRALRGIHGVPDMVAELRSLGRAPSRIHIQGMGDIIEACDGHYASQTFTTVLNRRDQVKVARRLIVHAIEVIAGLAPRTTVSAVPGNHGENRKNGKSYTDDGDNDDVAVFEQVADIVARCPELSERVSFYLPDNELQVLLDIGGANVGFHHGHVGRSGQNPQAKARKWWSDMVFSQSELEAATILVTAHYHHFTVTDFGPRWHIQCPTIDGGSKWWQDQGGGSSRAGTLAFTIRDGVPADWRIL